MIDNNFNVGRLIIKLNAVAENWQRLNRHVLDAQCGAVVKANAYGLGVAPIVETLYSAGCRTFFVATMDEAVELRGSVKKDFKIVVLGGQAAIFPEECVHYDLTPVLVSVEQVSSWIENVKSSSLQPFVKFDSGMHRFGLLPKDIDQLLNDKAVLSRLSPACFMSHLACADTPAHPLNVSQLALFSHYYSKLKEQWPMLKASLANSSGCFLDSNYHFDLSRPGIALYGGNPTPAKINPMESVVFLSLPIMQIKTIDKGQVVGYGADFIAPSATRIAIVFGGYADGLFRLLGNKGKGFWGGQAVHMIGRVSMDAIAFDITHISESILATIDGIEILGEHQSVDDLAAQAGTISYEVLTSLGCRYQRDYISAAR